VGIPLTFPALDGFKLGGVLFEPNPQSQARLAVVMAGGGGIPARRYRHFASFLAASGIAVLTFDYRGIGLSRPRSLRGFKATAEDWSEWDCSGAIAFMRTKYPDIELVGIAHSISSLIVGGAPNVGEFSRLVFIAAHTGYYGDYLAKHRIPMALLWHVVMPVMARMLGLGEDIPAGMALQWAARRTPELRPEATDSSGSRARAMLARYADIRIPALALSFSDDAFATDAGTRRLLAMYPNLNVRHEKVSAEPLGLTGIGHFGFFRPSAEALLWPMIISYLRT
jgi:predicted alpha/beta hydrolase